MVKRMDLFVGREKELSQLEELQNKKIASLVVIKGRRRVGKSRLLEHFTQDKKVLWFAGLAPHPTVSAAQQRIEFQTQLARQTTASDVATENWSLLFEELARQVQPGMTIVLDEITWMSHNDPTFLPKLKNLWDLHLSKVEGLLVILCGSVSSWIEKNIVSSTAFFGRISKKITVDELSLQESNLLLEKIGFKRSPMEKFLLLSLVGGIPWYIEQINPALSAPANIQRLCFDPDGLLVDEHRHIFHDLFGKRSDIYGKITEFLASGASAYKEIAAGVGYGNGGTLSQYLDELVASGYISRDAHWSFKTGKFSAKAAYRLSDNYLRFYYKYIKPRIGQISQGLFVNEDVTALPGWNAVMGLQFENLVLRNKRTITTILGLQSRDIVSANQYFQRKTKSREGTQIDLLVQTQLNTLFICEVKFSKREIGSSVIEETKEKVARLEKPKGFTCVPVLIHASGVTEAVDDSGYFYKMINLIDEL